MNYKVLNKCSICFNTMSNKVLSLPATPPANEFIKDPIEQETYPLDLMECNLCGHVQLSVAVDPEILFKNYVYVSGTSQSFVNHFKDYAKNMVNEFKLKSKSLVVDIGSNDGTLLKAFKQYDVKVLGVDPAENIAKQANQDGINTIIGFFNDEVSSHIRENYVYADLVTANNVFAHTVDLWSFVRDVKNILSDNGVFIFECSYLVDMINNMRF